MEKNKRKESIAICIAIVAAYLVLSVIYKLDLIAIYQHDAEIARYLLKPDLKSLFITMILMCFPYERVGYGWADFIKHFGIKTENRTKIITIEALVLYGIISGFNIWVNESLEDIYVYYRVRNTETLSVFLLTILMTWVIVNSFKLIKGNMKLLLFDLAAITLNGVMIYYLKESFFCAVLFAGSMLVAWNICNLISDRSHKLLSLFVSLVGSVGILCNAILITEKQTALMAWLNPEDYFIYSWEHLALAQHSLKMPEDLWFSKHICHPFISTNYYLGVGALLLLFLVFVIVTIAFVRSYKILSENRFRLFTFIYTLFAVVYIYQFLADLGFVPTAGNVCLIFIPGYILEIGIIIRLFIKLPVLQEKIENHLGIKKIKDYFDDDDFEFDDDDFEFDEDDLDLEEDFKSYDFKFQSSEEKIFKIIRFQAQEIKLINQKLDQLLKQVGEGKEEECDHDTE